MVARLRLAVNRGGMALALAVLALAALLAAVVVVPSRPESASAAFPGSNGKIAFTTHRDGPTEVYVMNADGTGQTRLTYTANNEYAPHWSPDGTKIVFDSFIDNNREIYVMSAAGGGQTRLTYNTWADGEAVWSPDGTKISFSSNRTGSWQIFTMDADGSNQTQLTSEGFSYGSSWSPDGAKIAYAAWRGSYDIYVMNADGSGDTQLTSDISEESSPDWSPDGTKIAYKGSNDIYVMNADGSGKVNLTNHPAADGSPAWSPDGTHIAFHSYRDGGNIEIYVMNAEGGQQTRIVGTDTMEAGASWQPVCEGEDCSLPFPIPTATPCPETGCPTPTQTLPAPTATPTLTPHKKTNGLDFSISTDAGGGAQNTCNSSGTPANVCQVPAGSSFTVSFNLDTLPTGMPGGKYQGYDAYLTYSGVTQPGTEASLNFSPWPNCYYDAFYLVAGAVAAGCAVGIGSPGSAYAGRMLTVQFTCAKDGAINLLHGSASTKLVAGVAFIEGQGASESLAIECVSPPTATPTPTPTPCPTADCLDFSIGVDVYSGGSNECSSSGSPTSTCLVPANGTFSVEFYLNSLPVTLPGGNYAGFDGVLQYTGVTTSQTAERVQFDWPDCVKDATAFLPGTVAFGCAIGIGAAESPYVGLMASVEFTCAADGTVTLVHGAGGTALVDSTITFFHEGQDAIEGIAIDCAQPLSPPGDSDGDRCPDAGEVSPNETRGGRRNFLNPWDYFNPTHDGRNRIDDVLEVLDQYFVDDDDLGYSGQTDRTYLGPQSWNLGPPDGRHRVDDIIAAVYQYFHDCG